RGEAKVDATSGMRLAQAFLRANLEEQHPQRMRKIADWPLVFGGERDELRYAATLPARVAGGGAWLERLAVLRGRGRPPAGAARGTRCASAARRSARTRTARRAARVRRNRRRPGAPGTQRGIALVLVLWLTILLTVIASGFAFSMRGEAIAARNAISLAQARTAADG